MFSYNYNSFLVEYPDSHAVKPQRIVVRMAFEELVVAETSGANPGCDALIMDGN
jgi:hypothetical protein